MSRPTPDWRLCVITDRRAAGDRSPVELTRAAIRGGATLIQLRDKHASARELLALGQALLAVTRPAGVSLIVNDRLDLALALDADGVHVGQEDLPAATVRRLLGPHRLLGVSAATPEEARAAERDGADYLGVGDLFGTPSKPDAGAPIGLAGLRAVTAVTRLPVLGIGGITSATAGAVIAAGAAGIAVISAVMGAPDPEAAARALRAIIDAAQPTGAQP